MAECAHFLLTKDCIIFCISESTDFSHVSHKSSIFK
jgi:hypothetical protein